MGNNSNPAAEPKRKKKGRPSLLDLQKRSLRLQKQQQQNQNQNQNQPPKNPNPNSRPRSTRRNPNPNPSPAADDDSSNGNRREKKLKLVHRIPNSASYSERDKEGERNNSSKGTDAALQDSGPTTPLPDKKLLEFILDRLQKKDTYGVYAEPVDPEELPDYHEIIVNPMDFATIRKKLSGGAYANLEQFEEDVFLISSNAMQYNSPDTIYYRQARAIQELAKMNFENLRQESDGNEPEPKTVVRRGRPPSKNIKRSIGRPTIDRAASDFSSNATLNNSGDGTHLSNLNNDSSRRGPPSESGAISIRSSYNLRQTEPFSWAGMSKSESNDEYSGYGLKGNFSKHGKRFPVIDDWQITYHQHQSPTIVEPSILTTIDGARKQLLPIGLHTEHAYARSLARFAANLGPIGWAITAKKIETVLPPGTKFGRGWVGDSEAPRPQHSQPPLLSASPPHSSSSEPNVSSCTTAPRGGELVQEVESTSNDLATKGGHLRRIQPPASISIASIRSKTVDFGAEPPRGQNHEGGSSLLIGCDACNIQSKTPLQIHPNLGVQSFTNGYTASGFNVPSQVGQMVGPTRSSGPFCSDAQMTHSRALDMVSRSNSNRTNGFLHQSPMCNLNAERAKLLSNSVVNSGSPLPVPVHNQNPEGAWRSLSQQMKQNSVPPDLNVRFQSPGSPTSGVMVDAQQPDLALQL